MESGRALFGFLAFESIAKMAFESDSKEVMRKLLPKLESRKPMPRELKRNVAAWKAWALEEK